MRNPLARVAVPTPRPTALALAACCALIPLVLSSPLAASDLAIQTSNPREGIYGARATVGITDYAQDALGDVVYVEVPDIGTQVKATDKVSEVESTKSVSDIFAPLSGTVVEVNGELADNPQRVNEDPYGEGWLCIIEVTDPSEHESLMDAAAYRALVEG